MPMSGLKLTPNQPLASQGDFFSGTSSPVFDAGEVKRGDQLKWLLVDRGLNHASAAVALEITEDELRGVLRGAYGFDIEEAKTLLRRLA
jgi:hypothetical protein